MLKRIFVYILFIALAARPAYFVGTVAYYETHVKEIIEKYCVNTDKPQLQCNGQCHLAKQLNPVNEKADTSKAIVELATAFFPVYFQTITPTEIPVAQDVFATFNYSYQFTYQFLLCSKVLKPPMV
ncbi:hypothetical protein [Ochrovirga pacifica]|uniref:hypothetical protein n=1 Tax=Ochrovirga pacifica TaxID=1042376 RepID=UPI0002558AEA|nr:hypothetical protein [Ochrovirga pacifica]